MRDCYTFCRFDVLAPEPPAPVEARDEGKAFVESLLAPGSDSEGEQGTPNGAAAAAAAAEGGREEDTPPCRAFTAADAVAALHPHCPGAPPAAPCPPALLALPGGDECSAEVVCCGCGATVASAPQPALGRKVGMVMALALFMGPCASPAAAPTSAPADGAEQQEPSAGSSGRPGTESAGARLLLAAGYEDGSLAVWEVAAPLARVLALRRLHDEPVMALTIDPAGEGGACGAAERQITLFRLARGGADAAGAQAAPPQQAGAAPDGCTAHAMSTTTSSTTTSSNGGMAIEVGRCMEARKEGVGDLALRADGKLLVAGGWDGRARLYKYRSGRPLAVLKVGAAQGGWDSV